MKIAICASMAFAREIMDAKKHLESLGHKVTVQSNLEKFLNGEIIEEDKWEKLRIDPFKEYFNEIKNNDAILILNYDKNNIKDYVGGNTLIEMAFAHILDKKIFMLNDIPQISYSDEIAAMNPIIINNDYKKIK